MEELSLRLVERDLIWPGIDLDEQIAFLDDLAFFEENSHQFPVHAAPHQIRVNRSHRAQCGVVNVDITLLRPRGNHGRCASAFFAFAGGRRGRLGALPSLDFRPEKVSGYSNHS